MAGPDDDLLGIDGEEMRNLGHRMVDFLVEHLDEPRRRPVLRRATPQEMAARIDGTPPAAGSDFEALLRTLAEDVLPYTSRCDHPRYFAFIPGYGTWPGALGDLLASAVNIYAGCWMEGAGPAQLELTVLDWFKGWIGYPKDAAGVLVSGGSAANMTALACAREALVGPMNDRVVAYVSDQSHSSVARAARVLGFRPEQLRVLPAGADYRMRPELLHEAITADRDAGRQPLFVSASAGATNTGAVDPLAALAEVCHANGVWLHADAAYGGFAALTERGRRALAGLDLADSVTLDPHKWLYQPFECGCLLVREGRHLREAFQVNPDYLADTEAQGGEVNFSDYGLQLTRMSRAVKLWLSLSYFGVDAFRDAIDRCLDLARLAQAEIEDHPALELVLPATLGIVCFRRVAPGADERASEVLNLDLVERLADDGFGLISSTRLHGRLALRLCVLNHASTETDVRGVLDWLAHADLDTGAGAASPAARPAAVDRDAGGSAGWTGPAAFDAATLATLGLFQGVEPAVLDQAADAAREVVAAAGEVLVRQWDAARELYVILEGSARVHRGETELRHLVAGDHFGELGALDWGSSFSYPRTATVTATSRLRALVLPGPLLTSLVRSSPVLGERVRASVHAHLGSDNERQRR